MMPDEFEAAKALKDKVTKKFQQDHDNMIHAQYSMQYFVTPKEGLKLKKTRLGE